MLSALLPARMEKKRPQKKLYTTKKFYLDDTSNRKIQVSI